MGAGWGGGGGGVFFFQAEDGIRDYDVTGVQTCALPIYEVGMWGGDDPDCRKPMLWSELDYDSEKAHFCDELDDCSGSRPIDKVTVDDNLFNHYQNLINLRKKHIALTQGNYKLVYSNDKSGIFAFERFTENERILAIFNGSTISTEIISDIFPNNKNNWNQILGDNSNILNGKDVQIFIFN